MSRATRVQIISIFSLILVQIRTGSASNLTLAWDVSTDPTAAGYNVYFGCASRGYTNMVTVGNTNYATISNLVRGATYYFAATTYNIAGLESDFSVEVSYTPPQNYPPTLDPLPDIAIDQDSAQQTVVLSGITSGSPAENQALTASAFSGNPTLIPNPTVNYTSPAPSGTLTFTPAPGSFGSAVMTVMVDDGGTVSNTIIRSFIVKVNPVTNPPPGMNIVSNCVIAPGQLWQFVPVPPYANGDRFSYALDSSAPAGARLAPRRGVQTLIWVPSTSQSCTTNLINIVVTDLTTPALSTNEIVQVTVLDYLSIIPLNTSVQVGQAGSLPIYVASSEGTTNLSFVVSWPTDRFSAPTVAPSSPNRVACAAQLQGTNLMVTLMTTSTRAISGSNLVAQLNFQALTGQPSAFLRLPISAVRGNKPSGAAYAVCGSQAAQVAVVSDVAMLEWVPASNASALQAYGKPGTNYVLQSSTNLSALVVWSPVLSYTQTNVAQTLSIQPGQSPLFYRLKQE